MALHGFHLSGQHSFRKTVYYVLLSAYLDDIETGAVLCSTPNADPNQVLGVLLQGHRPRYSGDPARTRKKEEKTNHGRHSCICKNDCGI